MHEEWWEQYPEWFIPLGITYLADARERRRPEIRRNAERGFVAVSLPERPHRIGFPSIFDEYWGPVMRRMRRDRHGHLHARRLVRSEPTSHQARPRVPLPRCSGSSRSMSCAEWVWSGWMVRYPELKIVMSEGGLGWVAMLLDRFEFLVDRSEYLSEWVRPRQLSRRCAAPELLVLYDRGPVDHRHTPSQSASRTSASRWIIPTATARGPTRST